MRLLSDLGLDRTVSTMAIVGPATITAPVQLAEEQFSRATVARHSSL